MTPLRQFRGVPADIIRKAEGKQFVSAYKQTYLDYIALNSTYQPWYRYFDLVSLMINILPTSSDRHVSATS